MRLVALLAAVGLLLVAALCGPGRSRLHEALRARSRRRLERRIDADLVRLTA
jgi:hypothetical protein